MTFQLQVQHSTTDELYKLCVRVLKNRETNNPWISGEDNTIANLYAL